MNVSRHSTSEECVRFRNEARARKYAKLLTSRCSLVKISGDTLFYARRSEMDPSFWMDVLSRDGTKLPGEWDLGSGIPTSIPPDEKVTFVQWMESVWLKNKDRFFSKRPNPVPLNVIDSKIRDVNEYRTRAILEIFDEYDERDVIELCKSKDLYTTLITFVGSEWGGDAPRLSNAVAKINKIFETALSMEADNISYRAAENELNEINAKIEMHNQRIEHGYTEDLALRRNVRRAIVSYYDIYRRDFVQAE